MLYSTRVKQREAIPLQGRAFFAMKPLRIVILASALLALVLSLSACGGGGTASLDSTDVAVVGPDHITKAQFDGLMKRAQASYKSQGRPFPKAGTADYQGVKNQAMQYLVQRAEYEQKAKSLGIKVDNAKVDARLKQIKQQYFGGDEKKYQAALKTQGLTETDVRLDIRQRLLSEQILAKVAKDAKVTDADIKKYYDSHKQQYVTPETRDVRHILVAKKALADSIYKQLKAGGDFGKLAKKYSKDPGSAKQGGKLTVSKGQTVPQFDKAAFAMKTNEISKPIHTQYGYHIIQPLSAVRPPKTTALKDVKESIRQQLTQTKKNEKMRTWVNDVTKEYKSKIKYAPGYAPPASAATTSTG
jgi:parvulin-like peptidyl-prolyl isomerase